MCRMISCTWLIGRPYSSLSSVKTTSCSTGPPGGDVASRWGSGQAWWEWSPGNRRGRRGVERRGRDRGDRGGQVEALVQRPPDDHSIRPGSDRSDDVADPADTPGSGQQSRYQRPDGVDQPEIGPATGPVAVDPRDQ